MEDFNITKDIHLKRGVLIKVFNYYKPSKYIITNSTGTVNKDWSMVIL